MNIGGENTATYDIHNPKSNFGLTSESVICFPQLYLNPGQRHILLIHPFPTQRGAYLFFSKSGPLLFNNTEHTVSAVELGLSPKLITVP